MLRQFRSLGPKFLVGSLVIDDEPLLDDLTVAPVANLDELHVQRFVPSKTRYFKGPFCTKGKVRRRLGISKALFARKARYGVNEPGEGGERAE